MAFLAAACVVFDVDAILLQMRLYGLLNALIGCIPLIRSPCFFFTFAFGKTNRRNKWISTILCNIPLPVPAFQFIVFFTDFSFSYINLLTEPAINLFISITVLIFIWQKRHFSKTFTIITVIAAASLPVYDFVYDLIHLIPRASQITTQTILYRLADFAFPALLFMAYSRLDFGTVNPAALFAAPPSSQYPLLSEYKQNKRLHS